MERREFLRTTALGSLFMASAGKYLLAKDAIKDGKALLEKGEMKIPIIKDVDIAVVGGSTAGVAAAYEASVAGSSVFLVAEETYLGYDITATKRFWPDRSAFGDYTLLQNMFPTEQTPSPLNVKKVLDKALIDSGVGFFFSSYLYDVLFDEDNNIAGIIIANRSGLQAIKAKVIIDTTMNAKVAKMAGASFNNFVPGLHQFEFVVIGNKEIKKADNLSVEKLSGGISAHDMDLDAQFNYDAYRYTYTTNLKENTYPAFSEVEQKLRSLTWDPEQFDSSDFPFYIPNASIQSEKKSKSKRFDVNDFIIESFIPKGFKGLYVLGSFADVTREAANELMKVSNYVKTGAEIGKRAYLEASSLEKPQKVVAHNSQSEISINEEVKIGWDFERTSTVLGEIPASLSQLPVLGEYDVVVMGGGTAGAPAGIGAARAGAKTLVLEYVHGLGGISTIGLIGTYWYGNRKGFTAELDKGCAEIGGNSDRHEKRNRGVQWVTDWKKEWLRREIINADGDIWFGTIGVGSVVENNTVKGVVVATPHGIGVVMAKNVIDATGSSDVAVAAGATFRYTDANSVAVQGSGLAPIKANTSYCNTDWTFINDSDVYDIWRSFVSGREKYPNDYDIIGMVQTRERRRIIGDYEIEVLDVYNGKNYHDTFSRHISSFDMHGFIVDPFFVLKQPGAEHAVVTADVPFRALLPKGIDGVIVTGLGASTHRDCMPVIRMQPCLHNQGYSAGMACAKMALQNKTIRELNIKEFQKELVSLGSLPEEILSHIDTPRPDVKTISKAIENVLVDLNELEILMWNTEISVPLLQEKLNTEMADKDKLVYAKILAVLGYSNGNEHLLQELKNATIWDKGWRFTGMGQFEACMSELDRTIMLLGIAKSKAAIPEMARMVSKLNAKSEFSHLRAIAEACEHINVPECADMLYEAANIDGLQGHTVKTIQEATAIVDNDWLNVYHRNNSLRELFVARALYVCGDKNGLGEKILKDYALDLRGHYARHAAGTLKNNA